MSGRAGLVSLLLLVLAIATAVALRRGPAPADMRPVPPWCEVVAYDPDARIVTDAAVRTALSALHLPWHVRDLHTHVEMLLVAPGAFLAGAAPGEPGASVADGPPRGVTIARAFYLGRYELTQAEWHTAMDETPTQFTDDPRVPVASVHWSLMQEFLRKVRLRLPTEAEWEYACRAGTTTAFSTGATLSSDDANVNGEATSRTGTSGAYRAQLVTVGSFTPNRWGFHDMHGNVAEVCSDVFRGVVDRDVPADAIPPREEYLPHAQRGGSFRDPPENCRSACRAGDCAPYATGFRVARDPDAPTCDTDPNPLPEWPPPVADPTADRPETVGWAEALRLLPDARIVTDTALRAAIEQTGLPWRVRERKTGMEMVLVPPGTYMRGASPGDDAAAADEKPAHRVTLTRAFYIGRCEVTNAQLRVGDPKHDSGDCSPGTCEPGTLPCNLPQQPVVRVGWDAAQHFCDSLALRLPTEAEWEYACRAGSPGARYGAIDAIARYRWNDLAGDVGGDRAANALGLWDTLGNVWEWCADWYADDEYRRCATGVVDPAGPAHGDWRVVRGGAAGGGPLSRMRGREAQTPDDAVWCRASERFAFGADYRNIDVGFRVARFPDLPRAAASSSRATAAAPPATRPRSAAWAEVLTAQPDPAVVTEAAARAAMELTGLPWRVRDRHSGIELLLVPPGTYVRGASPGDADADDNEKPPHTVTLSKPFYIGRFEVTNAEYRRHEAAHDSGKTDGQPDGKRLNANDQPVVQASWNAAAAFCTAASLRLPTEAEWEYACRAGSTTARYGPLDEIAWHQDNAADVTHAVGGKRANAFGLHDMIGNVEEMCADWSSPAEYSRCVPRVTDPPTPSRGRYRVTRGGWFLSTDASCRASARTSVDPAVGDFILGFRVARDP